MSEVKLKLSPPWITYLNQLVALFGNDPEITIKYEEEEEEKIVKMFVRNAEKAGALDQLLPLEKTFGNVSLSICVIPENAYEDVSDVPIKELFDMAFDGNPVYAFSKAINGMWSLNCVYVVFKKQVVQFFNDNLADIYGNISTLYQDIASDIFKDNGYQGIYYCTDSEKKTDKSLKEWP